MRPSRRAALALGGAAAIVATLPRPAAALFSVEALFAPRARLWRRWTAHDEASEATIDHGPWQGFLDDYLETRPDGVNRVAYRRVSAVDRRALSAYIEGLAALPINRYRRAAQRAYWINLYNALTVRLILDYMPVASIRDIDISAGVFNDGPWDKKLLVIEGKQVSLNDIEHRILRPIWQDARVHYAVNCASIGCPNLQPRAFTAADTDSLLEQAAQDYVNHPRGARVAGGRLVVSSIYIWFQEDFGGSDAGVIAHLSKYADTDLARRLAGVSEIADHTYDWALNE